MLILRDLAIVLLLSFFIGAAFSRLRQPVVLGYIIAGVASGPYALKLVENEEVVNAFADLGLVLLMFSLGLEFNIRKLRKVGAVSVIASLTGVLFLLGVGQTLGIALGFSATDAAFLGAALAISSTAIVVKLLTDMGHLHRDYAPIMLGILVVEDVAAVVLLTLFSSISLLTPLSAQVVLEVLMKIFLFFFTAYVLGVKVVPTLLEAVDRWSSTGEMLLLASLALCFSFAVFAQMLGFSLALGAFMMGAIVSESLLAERIVRSVSPIKDMFVMLFFVSVGMLIDVRYIFTYFPLIILVVMVTFLAKVASRSLSCYLLGVRGETSLAIGLGLVPIGEFSFAIVKQGVDLGVVSSFLYSIVVAVAALTTFAAPYSLKSSKSLASLLDKHAPSALKNFFSYSAMWMGQAKHRLMQGGEEYTLIRKKAVRAFINLTVALLILKAVRYAEAYMHLGRELSFMITFILIIPPIYLALQRVMEIVDILITLLSRRHLPMGSDLLRATFRNLSLLLLLLFSALYFLPPLLGFLTSSSIAISSAVLFLFFLTLYLSWRTVRNFYHGVERMVESVFSSDGVLRVRSSAKKRILQGLREGEVIDEIYVNRGDFAVGKSISELNVRERTGATILAIARGERLIHNPSPGERLLAGDVLIVFGSRDERTKLERLIRGVAPHHG